MILDLKTDRDGEGNGSHSSILAGKSHGERSLAGGCKRVRHDLMTKQQQKQ